MPSIAYLIQDLRQRYPDKPILEALAISIHGYLHLFEKVRERKKGKYPSFGLTEDVYTNALKVIYALQTREKIQLDPIPQKGKFEKYDVVLAELANWCLSQNNKLLKSFTLKNELDRLSEKIRSTSGMAKAVIKQNENAPKGGITYTEKQVVRDFWERLYNEARAIFKKAGEQNITLPIIPAGGDSLKDFQSLQGWIDEASQIVKRVSGTPAKDNLTDTKSVSNKAGKTKTAKQPITLRNFIETYCDLSAKIDVQSKVSLLHEYNLKGKIKLPKLAQKYQKGQHKYYYVDDLKNNWPTYQRKMPTLPPLKQPEN